MGNWESLIDETALAALLPAQYARFSRPVCDALVVFLSGLPADHQDALIAGQAALPATAGVSQRLAWLARSCPVLQKLGQILARNQQLAPELRQHLRELESLEPTVPWGAIQRTLTEELGSLDRFGVTLVPPAIAEASVAVVVPYRRAAGSSEIRDGVFKVLKPGIEQRLEEELHLLETVGEHLDRRCDELQIPHLDYKESFQRVREKLAMEIRLDQEQLHLLKAREVYADEPRVLIPSLASELCTSRVTAMQRVIGVKVTDCPAKNRSGPSRLAGLVAEALIAQPIFCRENQSLFHSDPHAGNLFVTSDERLAILDWSLVGTLGQRERVAVVQIVLGALTLDAERIAGVLVELAERGPVSRSALMKVVQDGLRRIRRGQLPGLNWLIRVLDESVETAQLRFAADLMLFRKSLHTLEGVIAEIASEQSLLDEVLLGAFVRHFTAEWPRRWAAFPGSREFATRLSNLDLTQTILSYPAAVARFWMGHGIDLLDACREAVKLRS